VSDRPPLLVLILAGVAERWGCAAEVSPLARADSPLLARLAETGRILGVRLVTDERQVCTAAPLLALLGLDPSGLETSRASYLALDAGVEPAAGERVLNADFLALFRDEVADLEPGPLRPAESEVLLDVAREALTAEGFRLHPLQGTHHLAFAPSDHVDTKLPSPERLLGRPLGYLVPAVEAHARAQRRAREVLEKHEVNEVRRELGDNGADLLWLSQPGGVARIASPFDRAPASFGSDAVWRGLSKAAGMELRGTEEADVEDLATAIDECGLCFVHATSAQQVASSRDVVLRTDAVAALDEGVVAAAAEAAQGAGARLMIVADRAWETATGEPHADGVPLLLWGAGIQSIADLPFTEEGAAAAGSPVEPGHGLLAYVRHI